MRGRAAFARGWFGGGYGLRGWFGHGLEGCLSLRLDARLLGLNFGRLFDRADCLCNLRRRLHDSLGRQFLGSRRGQYRRRNRFARRVFNGRGCAHLFWLRCLLWGWLHKFLRRDGGLRFLFGELLNVQLGLSRRRFIANRFIFRSGGLPSRPLGRVFQRRLHRFYRYSGRFWSQFVRDRRFLGRSFGGNGFLNCGWFGDSFWFGINF